MYMYIRESGCNSMNFIILRIMYIFLLFLLDPKLSLLKNPSEKFNVRYIFILIKKRIEFICIFL